MAAGGTVCRYNPTDTCQENAEAQQGEAGSLHERLVAYVHTLEHGARRGVWSEHSYARARLADERAASAAAARRTRLLLAPRRAEPAPAAALLDVDTPPSPPPSPPGERAEPDLPEEDDPADEEEWEARLAALAPHPAHAALARAALGTLRRMRLARLAGGTRHARDEARDAAARLRRALAPLWLGPGAARGAPAWLHAALTAHLPRAHRRLYDEALAELRRAVPRLAARLAGPAAAPAPRPALGAAAAPSRDPWLVWVSSGCAALDARWERRLSTLVHTRVLRAPGPGSGPAAAPEAWCAAAAGAVRDRLTDALAEAGDRSIILGGVGAGASLCLLLARGAGGAGGAAGGVRGAVLVAPALRTAEGARAARDDALRACRLPLLLVLGGRAPDADRSIASDVAEVRGYGAGGSRRLLLVAGADSALRLPRRLRRRLNLPQHALDAALAEECVRWALETAEGDSPPASPPAPPAPAARRHALPTILRHIELEGPDDEYAHLPQPAAAAAPAARTPTTPAARTPTTPTKAHTSQSARSIEIIEGRVVSRSAGGTPLPLLAPRRAAPPGAAPAPAPAPATTPAAPAPPPTAADIMQMPIVFADDNATDSSSTGIGSPVTVTSGKRGGGAGATPPVKMTRVIVAKRAPLAIRPPAVLAPAAPAPAAAAAPPGPVRVRQRRLLVRRGMRVLPPRRTDP